MERYTIRKVRDAYTDYVSGPRRGDQRIPAKYGIFAGSSPRHVRAGEIWPNTADTTGGWTVDIDVHLGRKAIHRSFRTLKEARTFVEAL